MRRHLLKLAIAGGLSLLAAAAGIELAAWGMNLDLRQGVWIMAYPEGWRPEPGARALVFQPRELDVDSDGFRTAFGRCDRAFPGRTLLVLGDSTTVQSTAGGRPVDFQAIWPGDVAEALGPDWQVCTLAEIGWHPTDVRDAVETLGVAAWTDRAVLLLCENDLVDGPPIERGWNGRTWGVATEAQAFTAWAPMGTPAVYWRSRALRFLSWRLALSTGESVRAPVPRSNRSSAEALQALDAALSLDVFYLPRLALPLRASAAAPLAEAAGVAITPISLPDDPTSVRRGPGDEVHLSAEGHRLVARQVLERLSSP